MNSTPPMRAARPPLSYLATHSTACSDALSTPDTLVGGSTPPTSIGWLSPDSDGRLAKEHPSPHITPALSSAASMPSVSPDPFATVPSMPTSLLEDPYLSLSAAANPSFNPFLPSSVPFLSAASDSQPGSTGMLDFLLAPDSACIGIPSAALPMSDSVAPGLTESCTAAPAAFTVPSVGNGGSPPQTGQPLGGFDRSWQNALSTAPALGTISQLSSSFPGATVNPSLRPFDLIDSPRVGDAELSTWKGGDEWGQPPPTPSGDACTASSPTPEDQGQSVPSESPSPAPVDLRRRSTEPSKPPTKASHSHTPVRKRDRNARFPCPKCGKVFTRNYNRLAHETVHEPDHPRPFICPAASCKKAFARKYDARRHYRLHIIRDHAPAELVERIVDSRRAPKP